MRYIDPEKWRKMFELEFGEAMQDDGCLDTRTEKVLQFIQDLVRSIKEYEGHQEDD